MPKTKQPAQGDVLVAYYRYSGGSGQTEQSIEGQRRDCQAYAKARGLVITHEYIDRHISGKTDNRQQFQRMMADSDKHAFTMLICWKTDRLARNRYDSAIYKSRLRKNGVKIMYSAESTVDGPEGIILEGLMESLAEYYSAELSQKLRRGQRESALKCHALGGNYALGYTSNKQHEFVVDEHQAPTVVYIFEQYAAGHSSAAIVADLNTKGKLTARGKPFNKNSILRILTNPQYIGTYNSPSHGVYKENAIPAIIDRDLWDKVQTMVGLQRSGRVSNSPRANYLLSGKLFCQQCNSPMKGISGTSKTGAKHFYYCCAKHALHQCAKRNIEKGYLENAVTTATAEYVLAPGKLDEIADRVLAVQLADSQRTDPRLDMLTSELAENERKQDNIMRAIEDGTGTPRLANRLHELEEQAAALRFSLSEIERPAAHPPQFTRDHLLFMLSQFRRAADEQDEAYKQRLLDTFVSAVYLSDDTALIEFNLSSPGKKNNTPESVLFDLFHGQPSENSDDITPDLTEFDHVSVGGATATPVEPLSEIIIVSPSLFFLRIYHITSAR